MKPGCIAFIGLLAVSPVSADVLNNSRHVIYVDDESMGMIWMVAPGGLFKGEHDAVAAPFIRRNAIYKTVNGEDIAFTWNDQIVPSEHGFESRVAHIIEGGWKSEDWINSPRGYRFKRLYNLSR